MRIYKYICDYCKKECPSPHVVIESFDQVKSGWVKKLTDEQIETLEEDETPAGVPKADIEKIKALARSVSGLNGSQEHNWRVVAPMKASGGVVQFCNEKCLAGYLVKLRENYQIDKLRE